MNTLSAYVRGALGSIWRGGYSEQCFRAAIVAPVLALFGFASTWLFPAVSEALLTLLSQAIDAAGIASAEGLDAAAALFANNTTAAFSALLWGLVPFAYLAALPLGFNFFALGVTGAYYVKNGFGLFAFLAGILPHGIFELPALVLFCAAGLHLCARVTARVRGNKEVRLVQTFAEAAVLYLYVILPLLALSALIEAFLTPRLLMLVLG